MEVHRLGVSTLASGLVFALAALLSSLKQEGDGVVYPTINLDRVARFRPT